MNGNKYLVKMELHLISIVSEHYIGIKGRGHL